MVLSTQAHENIAGGIFSVSFIVLLAIFVRRSYITQIPSDAPGGLLFRHAAFSAFGYCALNLTRVIYVATVNMDKIALIYVFQVFSRLFTSMAFIAYLFTMGSLLSLFPKPANAIEPDTSTMWRYLWSFRVFFFMMAVWAIVSLILDVGQIDDFVIAWMLFYVVSSFQLYPTLRWIFAASKVPTTSQTSEAESRGLKLLQMSLMVMLIGEIINVFWWFMTSVRTRTLPPLELRDSMSTCGFIALLLVVYVPDLKLLSSDSSRHSVVDSVV